MDLRVLRYFVAIADAGSITAAATIVPASGALPVMARASADPTMMVTTMSRADQCPNMRGPLMRSRISP